MFLKWFAYSFRKGSNIQALLDTFVVILRSSGDKKLEITFDIENLGNLLNDDWGRAESFVQPFNAPVVDVTIENGAYVYNNFTKPTQTVAKIPSVWKAQLGLRYRF